MTHDPMQALLTLERERLIEHPIHTSVTRPEHLRIFMEHHVFAVWDFMNLLKRLQQALTCTSVPWLPPADSEAARLVNEIVLEEETDMARPGEPMSHFELYLQAMSEVGAMTGPVESFIRELRAGSSLEAAVRHAPPAAAAFVRETMSTVEGSVPGVAAAFVHGREEILPELFRRLLGGLKQAGIPCPALQLYLERHIELDGDAHGPAAERLLSRLTTSEEDRAEALSRGLAAIQSRLRLWDALHQRIAGLDAAASS